MSLKRVHPRTNSGCNGRRREHTGVVSVHFKTVDPQGAPVPRWLRFAGAVKDEAGEPRTAIAGVTFALNKDQEGGAAL